MKVTPLTGRSDKAVEILEAFGLERGKKGIKNVMFNMPYDGVATLTVTYLADEPHINPDVFKQFRLEEIELEENDVKKS